MLYLIFFTLYFGIGFIANILAEADGEINSIGSRFFILLCWPISAILFIVVERD
jgi:hypothetical protein